MHIGPAVWSDLELQCVEIGFLHQKSQANGLAGQLVEIPAPFPADLLIN